MTIITIILIILASYAVSRMILDTYRWLLVRELYITTGDVMRKARTRKLPHIDVVDVSPSEEQQHG